MSALNATRTYALLSAFQAGDAAACALRLPAIERALDDVGLDPRVRPVLPVVKGAAAVGLLSVYRFPALARLTTFMLTVYFVLAAASHVRARDWSPGLAAASTFLALYGALTVKGPPVSR